MESIGNKLALLRNYAGYTRNDLANGICDVSTLFRIEKGMQIPRLDTLQSMCSRLNISIDYLLSFADDTTANYIKRMSRLLREVLYRKDYTFLKFLVGEAETFINGNFVTQKKEYIRCIEWYKSILIHKLDNKINEAENSLRNLLPTKIINELDINIANSLALILIQNQNYDSASFLLEDSIRVLNKQSNLSDKTLYPRIMYNSAYIHFLKEKYDYCIDICFKIEYYLYSNHLLYFNGEVFHLLGLSLYHRGDFCEAISYFQDAASTFSIENKIIFKIRSLKAIAEIHFITDNFSDGKYYLLKARNELKTISHQKDLDDLNCQINELENTFKNSLRSTESFKSIR